MGWCAGARRQPPQPRRRDRDVYAPGVISAPPVAQTGAPAAVVEPVGAVAEAEEKAAV